MPIVAVCTYRISVSTLKLFVVLSWMLAVTEHTTIGSYGVSGIAIMWHGIYSEYVEHASCHMTNNVSASEIPSTINTWRLVECLESL